MTISPGTPLKATICGARAVIDGRDPPLAVQSDGGDGRLGGRQVFNVVWPLRSAVDDYFFTSMRKKTSAAFSSLPARVIRDLHL
jgi:hypothetical protein